MAIQDVLRRLNNGEFDGGFSDRESRGTWTTLFIKDGVPTRRYQGKSYKFFDGKENERTPGKVEVTEYRSDEEKSQFIRQYGFIGSLFGYDDDAKEVSSEYYERLKKR